MTSKVADKDYFLDADGNVTDNEEQAATLLIRGGQEMSAEVAEKIGNQVAQEGEAEEDAESEEKAAKPSSNKKASPSKNKGAK